MECWEGKDGEGAEERVTLKRKGRSEEGALKLWLVTERVRES